MSFFPDPQRQSDIQFIFAKKLSYSTRIKFLILFLMAGFLIQLFINFWFGLVFLIIGMCLSFIKGYSHKPSLTAKEEWNQVTPDEYKKVKDKQKQLENWDVDLFDITNPLGLVFLVFVGFVYFFLYNFLFDAVNNPMLALYWGIDAIVLLGFHWITGVRTYLKKDKLIIKINMLEKFIESLSLPSELQILPMLATRITTENNRVPTDARLMLRFLNAPETFLGLQIQIAINDVQGTSYPYLYCVLLAKQEAKLFDKNHHLFINPPDKIIAKTQTSNDVDVLVIRQYTTKNSGYHTKLKRAIPIVKYAISLARQLIKNYPDNQAKV